MNKANKNYWKFQKENKSSFQSSLSYSLKNNTITFFKIKKENNQNSLNKHSFNSNKATITRNTDVETNLNDNKEI